MAMANNDHADIVDDEKSLTFRKRRLSLTQRQQESLSAEVSPHNGNDNIVDEKTSSDIEAKATATIAKTESTEPAEPTATIETTETAPASTRDSETVSAAAMTNGKNVGNGDTDDAESGNCTPTATPFSDDEKAHTFRKRRLSLTHRCDDEDSLHGSNAGSVGGGGNKAKRRHSELSTTSASSLNSRNSGGVLRARTLHSGELVSHNNLHPPLSPAINTEHQNVLYRNLRPVPSMPSAAEALFAGGAHGPLHAQQNQPKWKTRKILHIDEDERKLPFPRDVVGTFSCHGVEPIYDSDYEQDSDEDEVEWDEDIPRQIGPNPATTKNEAGEELDPIMEDGALPTIMSPDQFLKTKPTTAAKINQDRGGIAFPYGNCPRTALFAAYDGHGLGGELVSQFALHEIQSRLEKHPGFSTNIEKAFIDTFLAVDDALKHEPLIEPLYAGTTACVALLREKKLSVANAGDSRAIIARRHNNNSGQENEFEGSDWGAIDLTIDQNPDMPDEKQRIENMGGFVSPRPEPGLSARVWLDAGFTQIGLAMSRSIGDHAVARVGVIAEPVVSTHEISPDDEFMVIASDGVWEFLSSQEVVDIVGANISRGATKACQALIEASASKWHDEEGDYRDDITALVVRLQELWRNTNGGSSNNRKYRKKR